MKHTKLSLFWPPSHPTLFRGRPTKPINCGLRILFNFPTLGHNDNAKKAWSRPRPSPRRQSPQQTALSHWYNTQPNKTPTASGGTNHKSKPAKTNREQLAFSKSTVGRQLSQIDRSELSLCPANTNCRGDNAPAGHRIQVHTSTLPPTSAWATKKTHTHKNKHRAFPVLESALP